MTSQNHSVTSSHKEIPDNFGDCPYCGSNDVVKGSYLYSTLGTRQPTYRCKDCKHTFSYETYFNKKTLEIKVDTLLSDLQVYGAIEKTSDNKFSITQLGKKLIAEHSAGKRNLSDELILNLLIWKDISEKLPLHPTKEMFLKVLEGVLKEGTPNKITQDWLWNRYNVEVIPALERKARYKNFYGYIGITLTPNFLGHYNFDNLPKRMLSEQLVRMLPTGEEK